MEIFEYAFMIRAFAAGIIIAILASMLGMFIVVRRYAMLSDSLSHIALLGVAFGFLFSLSTTLTTFGVVLVASFLIEYLRKNYNIYSDSILSLFLSGALSISIIIVSLSNSFNTSLFDYLFGSILSIEDEDIYYLAFFGIISIVLTIYNYKKLLYIAFDEDVAQASGINTNRLNYMFIALVAITIGLSIKIVGALLIGALMIIPVISAIQYNKGFYATAIFSAIFSVLSIVCGLFISYYISTPSGATIVVSAITIFIFSLIINRIKINR